MIETSKYYRPFSAVRDVDCLISFSVMDTAAKKDIVGITESEAGVFSNIGTVLDDKKEPDGCYVSLEKNLWALDGNFIPLPDDTGGVNMGWWSDSLLTNSEYFNPKITVRFDLSRDVSTLGWTLHFDRLAGSYPNKIRIRAYNSAGRQIYTGVYDNDSAEFSLQHYLDGYRAVQFEFVSVPDRYERRVRLVEVDFGITKYYDRNSLGRVSVTYGADILSRSLPARELIFTFDNSDKEYNLLNPDEVYQHLQEGQRIEVKMSVGGEAVDMGEFRFTSADVSRSGIVPEITAHDALYALDGAEFVGTGAEMTLAQAVAAVLGDYELECAYDGGSADTRVLLAPPSGSSARETIRLLAQAAMCTVYIDRSGVLRFTQLSPDDTAVGSITADELYDYSGVSISEPVDGVSLNASGEYRLDEDGKQIQYIYTAGSHGVGSLVQTFSNPCVAPSMGSAVAQWFLDGLKMRKQYAVKNRCDPAVEIGDTLMIDDIFANRENAVVTGIDISYDGTLSAVTKGVGV